MIKGMTGFGRQDFSSAGVKGSVEIRTLNNRYFDLVCHLPEELRTFEDRIKKLLGDKIKRGRITVAVNLVEKTAPKVTFNPRLAREYLLALNKLQQGLRLKGEISLREILKLPGIFSLEEEHAPVSKQWQKLEQALRQALEQLVLSRSKEGKCLNQDILLKISQIRKTLRVMHKSAKSAVRLKSRVLSCEELTSFLKSSDINEELTRLSFHLNSLEARLKSNDSVGKELDFICQELLREINTGGAKLPDSKVSGCAIKIKSDIEKIREQVQNIE